EAGAITQHIGAYTAEYQGHKITFIDTPGHEAFTALRQRGANATDIVILVVAATEGVKPQTIEAINHARAARVPIIVAINKMDLPEADPEKVKRQLAEQGLIPEEWGGDTMMVEISAKTGQGVDTLLEAVLLKAEELNLRAPYKGRARGIILESRLDRGKGPVATVLVQRGTLKVGDALVAGTSYGRVRAMYDEWGNRLKEITPSTPALVQGFEELPTAGDIFYVVDTEKEARRIAEEKKELKKTQISRGEIMMTARRLQEKILAGELKELPIVVKADCQGSLEAIGDVLSQMVFEEIKARVIHQGIGNVTESDVLLASASEGIIVAFNVGIEANARQLAKSEGVLIKTYKVIYELIDDVRNILAGLLEPEIREVSLGQAEVRETFKIPKIGTVAGCYVLQGVIQRDALARVRRDGEVIFEGRIASLKRFKEDVREVQAGYECGIRLEGFDKIKVGDIIEAFKKEEVKKELV
ncbi:MAG: translation initiation factor IF-2, partial [Candidatus Hydrothermota bacterium]